MAFREVLVTQVKEVLRAWLAGAGKRPAARRAGVDVKTALRYIKAARAAGLVRDGDESQLTDELLGAVVAAVRPARPPGRAWAVVGGAGGAEGRHHRVGEGRPDAGEDRGAAGTVRDGGAVPDAGAVRRSRVRLLLLLAADGDGAGGGREARRGGVMRISA
jgi:hypothetical protein